MSDDQKKKKKGGFFKRAFGFKSKEDKLAEAAALKAEQQAEVDAQMAARMVAINAAALKAARVQDEAHLNEAEKARLEEQERKQAEAQAVEDAKAAKRLVEEKKAREAEAVRKAEEAAAHAKAEAEEAERLAAEQLAREKAEASEIARLKLAEEKAQKEAEQQAKLAAKKLAKAEQTDAEEAARLRAEAEAAKQAQEQEAARLTAEREQAEREAAARREAEKLEVEKRAAEKVEAERLAAEQQAADDAQREELKDQLIKEQAEREAKAAEERKVWEEERAELLRQEREQGFLGRISHGLSKSTSAMSDNISAVFNKRKLDAEALEDLEDLLIAADFGVGPATRTAELLAKDRFDKEVTDTEIKIALADVISETLAPLEKPLILCGAKPEIMLFVGVNGSGKTTTLGKIAKRYTDDGKTVLMAAGDTFRAAAVEQLKVWGERAGAPVVSAPLGADASGLVYDAITRAKAENYDILMIDTAGRLQNRTELMDELAKIVRVIKKQDDTAPHHSILVLDATVGQNALLQTEAFQKTAGITGLIMTKLDGTAKGGVLVALADKFKLPIHAIGIGERIEDLENFSAPVFAAALSGIADAVVEEG
ncbi:MAG: signal recognition particle-docking protein FtsY [Robiginitomaculum sp.]|nr:signal recognition particle-docking protein FtsY [Robiginitomaculum sp.]